MPRLAALLSGLPRHRHWTVDITVGLNGDPSVRIGDTNRMEPGLQTPEETFDRTGGSCRDSASLMVQILHNLGIAARFVSGYPIQLKPDLEAIDGPSGTVVVVPDPHGWSEASLPDAGWIGRDPCSGLPSC